MRIIPCNYSHYKNKEHTKQQITNKLKSQGNTDDLGAISKRGIGD